MTPRFVLKSAHATATTSLLFQAHLGNADIISSYVWQPCNQHQQESRKIYASEKIQSYGLGFSVKKIIQ